MFSFGLSSHGQLGLGNKVLESALPQLVASLEPLTVSAVSCGENHSLVTTASGQLYTFGDGRHGKLCLDLDTLTNHFSPTHVERFRGSFRHHNYLYLYLTLCYLSGFRVSKAGCGGCHTMILGVPRPLDEPRQEQQELKVLSEVNMEARERRRSGLKEESRLPPIRPKYSSRVQPQPQPQEETEERKEGDLDKANDNDEDEESQTAETGEDEEAHHEQEEMEEKEVEKSAEADLKEEKSGGKISKFFSSFKRKKHEGEKALTNGYVHEERKKENESDKGEDNYDEEKEPSPEKGKKRVSFFRQFSKENKEEERKEIKKTLPVKQERLIEEEKTMVSLQEEKIEDIPEEENEGDSEEREDEEESETETEDESELSTTTSPAHRNVDREDRQVRTNTKPVAKISGQKQTNNKVKSKSCVIL